MDKMQEQLDSENLTRRLEQIQEVSLEGKSSSDPWTEAKALERAEMIFKVRSGHMAATEAAEALGVSRRTYYKWEKKGMQAMLAALQNESAGRPSKQETTEVKALRCEVKTLTAKLDETAQKADLRLKLRLLERRDAEKEPNIS
jgi:transposase